MKSYNKDDFVKAYMEAYTKGLNYNEFAQKQAIKATILRSRAGQLKKKGVTLPSLARVSDGLGPNDIQRMNDYVDKILKGVK